MKENDVIVKKILILIKALESLTENLTKYNNINVKPLRTFEKFADLINKFRNENLISELPKKEAEKMNNLFFVHNEQISFQNPLTKVDLESKILYFENKEILTIDELIKTVEEFEDIKNIYQNAGAEHQEEFSVEVEELENKLKPMINAIRIFMNSFTSTLSNIYHPRYKRLSSLMTKFRNWKKS